MERCIAGSIGGSVDRWIDGSVDRWIGEWMERWIAGSISESADQ